MSTMQNSREEESPKGEIWPGATNPSPRNSLRGLLLLLLLSGLMLIGCDRASQGPPPRPTPQVSFRFSLPFQHHPDFSG